MPDASVWRRTARPLVAAALLLLAGVYVLVVGLLWWQQEQLLFRPRSTPALHRFAFGPDVSERWIDVPGARLNALHLQLPQPDGVVFFLHGNAGNLQSWFADLDLYRQLNLDLFMLDYRGFGKSSGRIRSESQLHADVRAAWDSMAAAYTGKRRVIVGRSLGSGLAATLAAAVQPEALVLISAYESMVAMADLHYPWVPRFVLRYPLRTDRALPLVRGQVLMAHGERDRLIPAESSRRLQRLLPTAELLLLPGAGHNDIQRFAALGEALRRLYAPAR